MAVRCGLTTCVTTTLELKFPNYPFEIESSSSPRLPEVFVLLFLLPWKLNTRFSALKWLLLSKVHRSRASVMTNILIRSETMSFTILVALRFARERGFSKLTELYRFELEQVHRRLLRESKGEQEYRRLVKPKNGTRTLKNKQKKMWKRDYNNGRKTARLRSVEQNIYEAVSRKIKKLGSSYGV
jgi:hypothetical protein